ncbi:MAG: hypothetical protein HF977_00335 [ANME-2 cluster archaeon]|nr:hypothetical protein [ANME-2 cluster archaeon]
MTKVISAETIYPFKLSFEARQNLSKSLYDVHKCIFEGLNEKEFDHYVVNSPSKVSKILIYRNKKKEIIGYFAVHAFEKIINDKQLIIFRAEAGLLPEYRHQNADICFWLKEAIKFKILHPRKEIYFLASPVNPSVYAVFAQYIHKLYPKYNTIIPLEIEDLMMNLADEFGLEIIDKKNPLIRKIGWITKATEAEKKFWQKSKNPHLKYYIESNPDFSEGHGFLILVPLSFLNGLISFFYFIIFYTLKKKIRYNLRRFLA